jgi:tRNA nucleotidyltransferase (CCA-adding enzyme)
VELITSHINADFDAFATMVAAQKLYPRAVPVFPGSQEKKLRDFMDSFGPFPMKRIRDIDFSSVRRLIVVDTKSPDRLGPLEELLTKPGVDVHVYDHHKHQEGDIRGSVEVLQEVGAASTILAELLKEKDLQPTPMEATILSMGIYEETGNLLYPTTTDRDLQAVSYLLRCGASLKIVSAYLKSELSADEVDVLSELTHAETEVFVGSLRVIIAKAAPEKYLGDAAHLAHRIMNMEYTDAVFVILSMQGKLLIVGRSRAPELSVSEVLEAFGGGGHPTAASATTKDVPLEIAEEKLIAVLKRAVKPGKVAADVMTTPVVTIEAGSTIKEAENRMTRYGVNVLPVTLDGSYRGIISRENVEKALFHGFRESQVIDFATTDARTAERQTQSRDVESVMIEQNQRFMPVLEGDRIIGAITRTDLLRAMYEDHLRRSMVKEPLMEDRAYIRKNIASWLTNRYPREIHELLKCAGETAESLGYRVYLVGGSVRDLLRGEENLDMDMVIEGDGIAFAQALGKKLKARVHSHARFGTAKIIEDHRKLDIATARTEYYESPAALPTVEMSSIKKDLHRRDFTINTLAVKLNPGEMGKLVDFFGGQRDIKERTIRVLHNLSFVEDPTRAFRAFRFAERFGFRLSKHTENLIKIALRMNLFDKLSGSRLYEEMLLIFKEKDPVAVMRRLADFGLLAVIHPTLTFSERLETLLTAVHDTLLWFDLLFTEEKPDSGMIYLTALTAELEGEDKEAALRRLATPPKVAESIIGAALVVRDTLRRLPPDDPALLHEALVHLKLETILCAMAFTGDEEKKRAISRYLVELRNVSPLLRGDDLKTMGLEPGPAYAELLREILWERLRGNLDTREDEERFAREKILRLQHGPAR